MFENEEKLQKLASGGDMKAAKKLIHYYEKKGRLSDMHQYFRNKMRGGNCVCAHAYALYCIEKDDAMDAREALTILDNQKYEPAYALIADCYFYGKILLRNHPRARMLYQTMLEKGCRNFDMKESVVKARLSALGTETVPAATPVKKTAENAGSGSGKFVYDGKIGSRIPDGYCRVVMNNGEVYEGDVLDGKFHGHGVYRYATGNIYEGGFCKGERHGKGVYRYKNGRIREVEHKMGVIQNEYTRKSEEEKGRPHGGGSTNGGSTGGTNPVPGKTPVRKDNEADRYLGASFEPNYCGLPKPGIPDGPVVLTDDEGKIVYKGYFKNGKMNGTGILYTKSSTTYAEFADNKPVEPYTVCFSDGVRYHGSFFREQFHGEGELITAEGKVYRGGFTCGQMNGSGELSAKDGTYYIGYFSKNEYHGEGVLKLPDGSIYTGGFDRGKKHGKGKLTWGRNAYEGDYVQGVRHGYGRLFLETGHAYEGQFANDLPHGEGRMVMPSGKVFTGYFTAGRVEGEFICEYPSGAVAKGTFSDGVMEGEGTITYPNGAVYKGEVSDDMPHGRGTLEYPRHQDVKRYKGDFENGKPDGYGEFTYSDGKRYEGKVSPYHSTEGKIYLGDGRSEWCTRYSDGSLHWKETKYYYG